MGDLRPIIPATRNLRVSGVEPLVTPAGLLAELPITRPVAETVVAGRAAVRDILAGTDPRLLVVVGPCSIHDPEAGLEYAERLAALRTEVDDVLCLVLRAYFEKPRTTLGWKGLISDPHLDGTRDMAEGLRIARRMLLRINALGLPVATELLGPVVPQYIADLVAWTAIGARTAESQTHREMASGLSMPVGFKNTTDGNLTIALDAMQTAATPHSFLGTDDDGRPAIIHTTGNADRHLVLRGGGGRTNYDAASVAGAAAELAARGLPVRVMVDCSHGNSSRDYTRQPAVFADVVRQVAGGSRHIMGAMLESHLHEGSQPLPAGGTRLRYGVSITDGCIDWTTTDTVLRSAADRLRAGREATARERKAGNA